MGVKLDLKPFNLFLESRDRACGFIVITHTATEEIKLYGFRLPVSYSEFSDQGSYQSKKSYFGDPIIQPCSCNGSLFCHFSRINLPLVSRVRSLLAASRVTQSLTWRLIPHPFSLRYVERFPADDKPSLGQLGRNRHFINIYFWTGARPWTSCFQAAHGTPIFKKSIFWKFKKVDFSKLMHAGEKPRTCPDHPHMIPEYFKIDPTSAKIDPG